MQLSRTHSWPCAAQQLGSSLRLPVVAAAPAPRACGKHAPRSAAQQHQWRVPAAQARPCHLHQRATTASVSASALRCVGVPAPTYARAAQRHSSSGQHQQQQQQRSGVVAQSGWGAPVEFKPAKVVSNTLEATGMHKILVDIGQELAAKYTRPGQYIQAKVQPEGKAGFFAIASAPDANNQGVVELLIKVQPGATAEEITKLPAGAQLLASAPQGGGFPVERIPASAVDTVLLFATGSGISPIKAVIDSDVLEVGKRKEVRLYYGSRSPELTAYKSLIPEWTAKGVKVIQVLSGNSKKYVQGAFAEDAAQLKSPGTVGVLLCGQKDMSLAIKEICKEKGVPQEAVLSNF